MNRSSLKLILLLSVILRIAAALYLGNEVRALPGTADQISYHTLALRLLDGHGFSFGEAWWPVTGADSPTAHWSYLYTAYLVVVYALFGPQPLIARLIQAVVVGLLQPYLAYRLAQQMFKPLTLANGASLEAGSRFHPTLEQSVPLLAAAFTAVYIYFIYYAATLMTEPFYITAVLATLLLTIRLGQTGSPRHAVSLGMALGAAVLLRQLFLVFVPFIFLWLGYVAYKRRTGRATLAMSAVVTLILLMFILPVTLYNYTRFERFVLLNTNAGYALFWANHPIYGNEFTSAQEMGDTYQKLVPPELRPLDEAALDQALLKQGIGFVLADPLRYIRLSLSRIPAYFKFWPETSSSTISNLSRVGSFGLFLPLIFLGLFRPFRSPPALTDRASFTWPAATLLLLYLFFIIYSGIHILSWAQVRYRLPVDAVLILFAALAAGDLLRTFHVSRFTDKTT